jgi:hypothetical protein
MPSEEHTNPSSKSTTVQIPVTSYRHNDVSCPSACTPFLTKRNSVRLKINNIHPASYVMVTGLKQPLGEANHSCPSGAKVRIRGATPPLSHMTTAYTATTSTASYKIFPDQIINRFDEFTETEGS